MQTGLWPVSAHMWGDSAATHWIATASKIVVTRAGLNRAVKAAYQDVIDHHTLQVAAALSYYFILALFPGLIFLSAVMGSISFTDFFIPTLDFMRRVLPPDTMRFVQSMLYDVLTPNRKTWLSLGMLGMIWVASSAFDATIEALDIAYDVKDSRPFWKTRLLAIVLGGVSSGLWIVALAVMMAGPRFGEWLATKIPVSRMFVICWPVIHWTSAITFTVLAVEAFVFSRSQCEATVSGDIAGRDSGCYFLDCPLLHARNLFPAFCQLQPHLRDIGGIHRISDVAVLEFIRPAPGRRTEPGTGERERARENTPEGTGSLRG